MSDLSRRELLTGSAGFFALPLTKRNQACVKANEVAAAFARWANIMNASRDQPDIMPADAVAAFTEYVKLEREFERLFWHWVRYGG